MVVGDLKQTDVDIKAKRKNMIQTINEEGLVSFCQVNVVPNYESGVIDIAQASGIAGLEVNTIMFGWPTKSSRLASILRIMHAMSKADKSTIIARLNWAHEPGQQKRIDIWWRGLQQNGDLMLLLAHLLNLNLEWKDAKIFVRTIVEDEKERDNMENSLNNLVPETRIQAETEVIVKSADSTFVEIMQNYSRHADIVFLGLMEAKPGTEAKYAKRLIQLASGVKTTNFVRIAGELAGKLI